tara:strand:- start:1162 stop:4803 length:3642 start_codon:yes stop_codon:yes gene_type:complete
MAGNLLGEAIDYYVSNQVRERQNLLGKGFNNPNLSNADLNLINNKNAWLKLASSVYVGNPTLKKEAAKALSNSEIDQAAYDNIALLPQERLQEIGLNINEMAGLNLAKKTVLFNTLSEWDSKAQKYNFRSGIVNTKLTKDSVWNSNNSYGLGSPSKGLQPAPGLLSLSIENLNRGSIREANIEIKCFNKTQFEILDLVYLRLGYHMIIEWGWDKYIANDTSTPYKTMGNTVIEEDWFQGYNTTNFNKINRKINAKRKKYDGNYDGFVGRVKNMDWNMESDGTFTVQLSLMSTGDIIESMKTNLALSSTTLSDVKKSVNLNRSKFEYKADSNEFKSIVVSKAAESTIHYDLFSDLINKNISWNGTQPKGMFGNFEKSSGKIAGSLDYLNVFQLGFDDYYAGSDDARNYQFYDEESKDEEDILLNEEGFKEGLDDHLGYFLTFEALLNKIKELIIPNLSGDQMITINNDVDMNLCSVYPNLISLDPRICYIQPFITEGITIKGNTNGTYVNNDQPLFSQVPKAFGFQEKTVDSKTGKEAVCVYGKIMNIYLNYDFVGKCLEKARNDEGDITLFKFLKSITDGINTALGNTTNLEVTLRNDNQIVIIDQNPIPGLDSLFPQLKTNTVTNFNLFGFNTSQEQTTSNFVKSFKFSSKLTPATANMISIGAAAGGLKTKNSDVSGFANWNKGLEDNIAYEYADPIEKNDNKNLDTGTGKTITRAQVQRIKKAWDESDKDEYGGFLNMWKRDNPTTYFEGEEGEGFREVDECPETGESFQDYTWEEYGNAVNNILQAKKSKAAREGESDRSLKEKWGNDYLFYLVRAFGGVAQGGYTNNKQRYLAMDSKFIKEGIKCFKAYKSIVNNLAFQNKATPSNQTGFIPLDLSITCDGIGGFKIYNALNINQDQESLLPYQYKNISNFLIQKVNHKIENDSWETTLETLSIPKVQPPDPNEVDLYATIEGQYNPYNPGPEFTPTKQPWSAVFISYVVKEKAGVDFPVAAAHRIYSNTLNDATLAWRNEYPGIKFRSVGGKYFRWKVIDPYRISSGKTGNNIADWFIPKVGDIMVYNRDNNTNVFTGGNWSGATHGDIVTEVTGTAGNFTYKAIGGNLSDTSKFSTIAKSETYTTAKLNAKASNKLFVVLRPGNNDAQKIADAAKAEKEFWAGRKETVANDQPLESNKLYDRMTAYWKLVGITSPQWGQDPDPSAAAANQQKDNFT